MIEFRRDNLLEADAEALVNTVNTVGVMGKGIALQFKKKFPENFKAYERACKNGEVEIGKMFTFPTNRLTNPRYIINFPTKQHWREKSRLEYVREGLDDLLREIKRLNISSVAIPPLGCGNGGLDWETEVRPLIEEALSRAPRVRAYVYEPSITPGPIAISTGGPKPDLTTARAAMLGLIAAYKASHYTVGRLVAQKLAYFMQTAGEGSLNLEFKTGKFGPYADELKFLLQKLEGHYITGLGDMSGKSQIELLPGAKQEAEDYLRDYPETEGHLEKVAKLIEGFETPYGMELLATVHWAAAQKGATTLEDTLRVVRDWSPRKGDLFSEGHVAIAREHLEEKGWMPATSIAR